MLGSFGAAGPGFSRCDQKYQPTPGAPDIGDPLFPGLGNGGYDVSHYTIDLDYQNADSVQTVPGTR